MTITICCAPVEMLYAVETRRLDTRVGTAKVFQTLVRTILPVVEELII